MKAETIILGNVITMDEFKAALQTALPDGTIIIKSQGGGTLTYSTSQWRGNINSIDVAQMYEISVGAACTITLSGTVVNPAEHPAVINSGTNWIGFPVSESMSLTEAFVNFTPANGDIIKNQNASATYYFGNWYGQLKTLQPGKGYIYRSSANVNKTLVFPSPF